MTELGCTEVIKCVWYHMLIPLLYRLDNLVTCLPGGLVLPAELGILGKNLSRPPLFLKHKFYFGSPRDKPIRTKLLRQRMFFKKAKATICTF